jgi:hypothetical protein
MRHEDHEEEHLLRNFGLAPVAAFGDSATSTRTQVELLEVISLCSLI